MTDMTIHRFPISTQVSGGGSSNVDFFTPSSNGVFKAMANITANDDNGAGTLQGAGYEVYAGYIKTGASITQIESAIKEFEQEQDASWDVTLTTDGSGAMRLTLTADGTNATQFTGEVVVLEAPLTDT